MHPHDELIRAARRYVREVHGPDYRCEVIRLVIHGERLPLVIPVPRNGDGAAEPDSRRPSPDPPARHGDDYRSVHWFGSDYLFNGTQAAVVKVLWEAWEDGEPVVGGETLLEAAAMDNSRIRDIFRGHPAWGTMIVPVGRGSYSLKEP